MGDLGVTGWGLKGGNEKGKVKSGLPFWWAHGEREAVAVGLGFCAYGSGKVSAMVGRGER